MEHLVMECVKIRRLLFLLLLVVIVSLVLFALSSATVNLQLGPSFGTVNEGPAASVVHGLTYGGNVVGGLPPIVGSYHIPNLRNANIKGLITNGYAALKLSSTNSVPDITGIEEPSAKTVNAGHYGRLIDSFSAGGVVLHDGPVVVAPSVQTFYEYTDSPQLVETIVSLTKSHYVPEFDFGFVPLPYSGSVISVPSSTIIA